MEAFERQRATIFLWINHLQTLLFGLDGEGHLLGSRACLRCSRGANRLSQSGFRLTRRTRCCPFTRLCQASGLTRSGTRGREGRWGKATRGGRLPQLMRFLGSLPIRVSGKGFCQLANLIQGLGTMEPQTLLCERAMVPLHKPILLWVMRIADEHRDSEGLTKTDQGGRKVTADGGAPTHRVSRSRVMEVGKPCSGNVWATAARAVSAVKSVRTLRATRTEVPLSMILRVSTTCCFLPCGSCRVRWRRL